MKYPNKPMEDAMPKYELRNRELTFRVSPSELQLLREAGKKLGATGYHSGAGASELIRCLALPAATALLQESCQWPKIKN